MLTFADICRSCFLCRVHRRETEAEISHTPAAYEELRPHTLALAYEEYETSYAGAIWDLIRWHQRMRSHTPATSYASDLIRQCRSHMPAEYIAVHRRETEAKMVLIRLIHWRMRSQTPAYDFFSPQKYLSEAEEIKGYMTYNKLTLMPSEA